MPDALQVTTTTGDRDLAERIGTELVDRRLAACAQVSGPIESIYRWRGKIERGEEWRCVAKTTTAHFAAIESLIAELHPYDVPELIATPIVAAGRAYLDWLRGELGEA
ncbi:MAG: divalent-cation tolerance protein CutA [Planctomycetota bacterium]